MPFVALMIAAGVVAIAGRLIGAAAASGDLEKARQMREAAIQVYGAQAIPQLDQIALQTQQKTNLSKEDPRMANAQQAGVDRLMEGNGGALDAEAKAQLAESEANTGREYRGMQGAIDASAARSGTRGSGLEYLGRQMGAQQAANSMATTGAIAAGDASTRALQRLGMGLNYAGQKRQQDQEALRAQDIIDRFNTETAQKQTMYNQAERPQQNYENALGLADRKAGAYRGGAADYQQAGQATEDQWSGAGQDASAALSSAASSASDGSDSKKKKG